MINTRVYTRAPRLQLRPVVREETRVEQRKSEREKGNGREEEMANRSLA